MYLRISSCNKELPSFHLWPQWEAISIVQLNILLSSGVKPVFGMRKYIKHVAALFQTSQNHEFRTIKEIY